MQLTIDYDSIKIGSLWKIDAGTWVWSIDLQELICFSKDQVVKITHTVWDKQSVFAKRQLVITWYPLAALIGEEKASTVQECKDEISLDFTKLKPYALGENLKRLEEDKQ